MMPSTYLRHIACDIINWDAVPADENISHQHQKTNVPAKLAAAQHRRHAGDHSDMTEIKKMLSCSSRTRLINFSGGAEGPSGAKPRQFERKVYLYLV